MQQIMIAQHKEDSLDRQSC